MSLPAINPDTKETRKFGMMFSGVFLCIAMIALWKGSVAWGWYLAASGVFMLLGVAAPRLLSPLRWAWMKFAFALGWSNTRLLLGIVFFFIITPFGLVTRLLKRDTLRLKFDRAAPSYWIIREPKPFDPKRSERLF